MVNDVMRNTNDYRYTVNQVPGTPGTVELLILCTYSIVGTRQEAGTGNKLPVYKYYLSS